MEAKKQILLREVSTNPDQHTKAIHAFKDAYEGLSIGAYTDEVFEDVLLNGSVNIAEKFKEDASEQLDKSGVKSPLLKANLLKGCDEVLADFNNAIDGMVQSAVKAREKQVFDKITAKQMKVKFMGIGGKYISFQNENVKRLQIGIGGGFVTDCNKSFDTEYSKIELKASEDTYHLYMKLPRKGESAHLVAFTSPQPNTDDHFFIHWQSGSFTEIKIPS
jgi:hypothetical protein